MTQSTQKKRNKKLLLKKTIILLLINLQNTTALTSAHNFHTQKTQIYSDHQDLNMITNTLIITGNIVIQKNYISIYADKIIITYPSKQNKEKKIDIFGTPVIFYQSKNKKKQIFATSSYMSYQKSENIILLQGKAFLKKKNITLESDYIKYIIKKKYIETYNNQDNKTKITMIIDTDHTTHIPIQPYKTTQIYKIK